MNTIANAILLVFILGVPLYGSLRKLDVFSSFVEGAKEGFDLSVKIIPYLVAMLVAIGMLRASGFFEIFSQWLAPILTYIGMPPDLLPLALLRPFSGSAALAMTADIAHTYGGDALISKMAGTLMGSTETTFYVIAVYFGSVGIRRTRYAIPVGLLADAVGVIASVVVCQWMFGS
jgi:spore maturation protein B